MSRVHLPLDDFIEEIRKSKTNVSWLKSPFLDPDVKMHQLNR